MAGLLHGQQDKTKAKLRIVIKGELKSLLDEIQAHKSSLDTGNRMHSLQLLVNESCQPMNLAMPRKRFDVAHPASHRRSPLRSKFIFPDLRAY